MKRFLVLTAILILVLLFPSCVARKAVNSPAGPVQAVSGKQSCPVTPYGYAFLNEKEKGFYDLLTSISQKSVAEIAQKDGFLPAEGNLPMRLTIPGDYSYEEIVTVTEIFMRDHVPASSLKTTFWPVNQKSDTGSQLVLYEGMDSSPVSTGMAEELERRADEITASIITSEMGDYAKIKAIALWIVNHVSFCEEGNVYSKSYKDTALSKLSGSAYGALVNKSAVCTGYAEAFNLLAQKAGIYSLYVTGNATGTPHAWNMVWLEGDYYHLDTTWMDNAYGVDYTYFLANEYEITRSRNVNDFISNIPMPEAAGKAGYYFKKESLDFETADAAFSYLKAEVPIRSDSVQVKVSTAEEYRKLYLMLTSGDSVYGMLFQWPEEKNYYLLISGICHPASGTVGAGLIKESDIIIEPS